MDIMRRVQRNLLHRLLPLPIPGRHVEYSVIASADDDGAQPTPSLLALALKAIEATQTLSLTTLAARIQARPDKPKDITNLWPGEHYRLLAGIVQVVQPKLVIEIGTGAGGSTLAMRQTLPPNGKIITFDVVDPRTIQEYVLQESDFADGRLEQVVLNALEQLTFRKPVLLVCDDIRVWNMIAIWRRIRYPKLDLTSFGHWTGTGLVEWPPSMQTSAQRMSQR